MSTADWKLEVVTKGDDTTFRVRNKEGIGWDLTPAELVKLVVDDRPKCWCGKNRGEACEDAPVLADWEAELLEAVNGTEAVPTLTKWYVHVDAYDAPFILEAEHYYGNPVTDRIVFNDHGSIVAEFAASAVTAIVRA